LRVGSEAVNGDGRSGGMSDAEIGLCFEYGAEDAPIDLDKLFSRRVGREVQPGGKKVREPRGGT
jgi:hypothetical protein